MTTSPLGRKLRDLGFRKVPGVAVSQGQKALSPPSFSALGDPAMTFATDDLGQSWMRVGTVDLSSFGFNNTSEQVREVSEAMGFKKKP